MPSLSDFRRAARAGAAAFAANLVLLMAADALGIETARGGLQRLVKMWLSPVLVRSEIAGTWADLGLPSPDAPLFMIAFKAAVALAMALAYCGIAPLLPGRWWTKGLLAALAVWLVNAGVVLPLLDQGFAGAASLTAVGMAAFAVAHTTYFIVLAGLYARRA